MEFDLSCRFDARQSFYGKARVKEIDGDYYLYSYGTLVAKVIKYENKTVFYYLGKFSQTTTRHQKEFFRQNGLSEKEIKQLMNGKQDFIEITCI